MRRLPLTGDRAALRGPVLSGSGQPPTTTPTGSELPPLPPATNPTGRLQSLVSLGPKGSKPGVTVRRGGNDYAASVNSTLQTDDALTTDDRTIAAVEFLIGGRVGINKSTNVEMVNERSVADGKISLKRAILKNGSLWIKADAKALKEPIEIQTNGGILGIRD